MGLLAIFSLRSGVFAFLEIARGVRYQMIRIFLFLSRLSFELVCKGIEEFELARVSRNPNVEVLLSDAKLLSTLFIFTLL